MSSIMNRRCCQMYRISIEFCLSWNLLLVQQHSMLLVYNRNSVKLANIVVEEFCFECNIRIRWGSMMMMMMMTRTTMRRMHKKSDYFPLDRSKRNERKKNRIEKELGAEIKRNKREKLDSNFTIIEHFLVFTLIKIRNTKRSSSKPH